MEDIELRREEPASTESQESDPLQANVNDMKQWQIMDPTLARAWKAAEENEMDARVGFYHENGLFYWKWRPEGSSEGDVRACQQLVLPHRCRQAVLHLAHDVLMAGHVGIFKTKDHILQQYYWPGIFSDVAKYCRTCGVCQRSNAKYPRAKMKQWTVTASSPSHYLKREECGEVDCKHQ